MIDRIAKLLNKAERAATPEEAQTYFDKAQALATAHSISLAKARLLHAAGTAHAIPVNKTVRIGDARKHINRHLVLLMSGIASANDLKMDIAHNSTYVILYGFPSDIATAEQLWVRISTQMVRFGESFLATGAWRDEVRYVFDGSRGGIGKMTRQSARASYYRAFVHTVSKRIQVAREQEVRVQSDRDARPGPDGPRATAGSAGSTTAVALRAKDLAVSDYYSQASSARGSWRGDRSSSWPSDSAHAAGRRDGHRASLSDRGGIASDRKSLRS